MEGDRKVILSPPGDVQRDKFGQRLRGLAKTQAAWALRTDRRAAENEQAATVIGNWSARFRVRRPGIESIDSTWTLTDTQSGLVYDIESIAEDSSARRRRWLFIYAVARTAGV